MPDIKLSARAKRNVSKARARLDRAIEQVYRYAEDGSMPFSGCLARAPAEVQSEYVEARAAYEIAQTDAVRAGSAYRDAFGGLIWYRR